MLQQEKKKLTEAVDLFTSYAEVVVVLDEMVQHSHAKNLGDASIEQMAKLQLYPVRSRMRCQGIVRAGTGESTVSMHFAVS